MEAKESLPDSVTKRRTRLRHIVVRNVGWNWIGMVVDIISGFVVAPFLVRQLGVTGYGLWIVIGSLSGYFSLVDIGLRGSVARQLALYRATERWDEVNRTLNSALAIFSGLTAITLVATVVAAAIFERLFDVPADQIRNAKIALVLVGVNLAVSFPLQVFDGNLWAAQRFDILNYIDIPITLIRVGLTFAFVHDHSDLVTLAIISLMTTLGGGAMKALFTFRMDRLIRLGFRYVLRESGASLFSYGWWSFVLNVARLTKTQLTPVMIGSLLDIALVTPFSIARRLQDYAHKVIWTATGVLVPVATAFHARSEREQQQRLFIEGGKYSAALAIFFLGYFLCLGESLIRLWMGAEFADAALLLTILVLGEFGHMTQSVGISITFATARHRSLAWLALAETIISVTLIVLMARRFGLVGTCLALALPQAAFTGVGFLLIGCRVTGVGLVRYMREAMVPATIMGVVPILGLTCLTFWHEPNSWLLLVFYSAVYTLAYGAGCWGILKPVLGDRAFTDLKTAFLET